MCILASSNHDNWHFSQRTFVLWANRNKANGKRPRTWRVRFLRCIAMLTIAGVLKGFMEPVVPYQRRQTDWEGNCTCEVSAALALKAHRAENSNRRLRGLSAAQQGWSPVNAISLITVYLQRILAREWVVTGKLSLIFLYLHKIVSGLVDRSLSRITSELTH